MILERNVSQQRAGRSDQNMATEYKIENRVLSSLSEESKT